MHFVTLKKAMASSAEIVVPPAALCTMVGATFTMTNGLITAPKEVVPPQWLVHGSCIVVNVDFTALYMYRSASPFWTVVDHIDTEARVVWMATTVPGFGFPVSPGLPHGSAELLVLCGTAWCHASTSDLVHNSNLLHSQINMIYDMFPKAYVFVVLNAVPLQTAFVPRK